MSSMGEESIILTKYECLDIDCRWWSKLGPTLLWRVLAFRAIWFFSERVVRLCGLDESQSLYLLNLLNLLQVMNNKSNLGYECYVCNILSYTKKNIWNSNISNRRHFTSKGISYVTRQRTLSNRSTRIICCNKAH